jgi:hypothetical protein
MKKFFSGFMTPPYDGFIRNASAFISLPYPFKTIAWTAHFRNFFPIPKTYEKTMDFLPPYIPFESLSFLA